MKLDAVRRGLLVAIGSFPFLSLAWLLKNENWAFPQNILEAVQGSVGQSLLSGLLSVVLGFAFSLGLISASGNLRRLLDIGIILPFFLPSLFSLNACLSWVRPFPYGIWGVAIVHTVINSGFLAVSFGAFMEERFGGWAELAFIEGASSLQIFWALRRPLLQMFALGFVFVFAICMSSFLIPLIAGGNKINTLEMLIFEQMKGDRSMGLAATTSLVELALVGFALYVAHRFSLTTKLKVKKTIRFVPKFWRLSGVFPVALSLVYIVTELSRGILQASRLPGFLNAILELLPETFLFGGAVALFGLILFFLTSYAGSRDLGWWSRPWGQGSPMLVALSVLPLPVSREIKFVYVMGVLSYFSLWRLWCVPALQSLAGQCEVARLLGAPPAMIFIHVIWPQTKKVVFRVLAVAATWTMGDYAIAKLILSEERTLGVFGGNLMSSYRTQSASVVILIILATGACLYALMNWIADVFDKKLTA